MNFTIIFVIFLVAVCRAETTRERFRDVDLALTEELCERDYFKDLRTCQILKSGHPEILENATRNHACFFHHENGTEINEGIEQERIREREQTETRERKRDVASSSSISHSSSFYDALMEFAGLKSSRNQGVRQTQQQQGVAKRSVFTVNPCIYGFPLIVAYNYAIDYQTGVEVELVQNPAQNLYQKFHVQLCGITLINGYSCEPESTIYETLVYKSSGQGTEVRFVMLPTTCALHESY